jgi:trans-2,3-dihydro-3-hydroxyanthranilate isomerase
VARRYPFVIADVFTDRPFSGNQLAVVFDADDLPAAQMQAIATEFGFSESTFVQASGEGAGHDFRVRIFTPDREVPFAGHPTVGTALALAWRGLVPPARERVILGEGAGPVPVDLTFEAGHAVAAEFAAPREPSLGAAADPAAVAEALGLGSGSVVATGGLPRDASCGLPFLFAELADLAALGAARLRGTGAELSPAAANGVYLFTRDTGGDPAVDIRARMFAPAHGIAEDPATGSAAAALAALLTTPEASSRDGTTRYRILQGAEMGRPSRIAASARVAGGRVVEVRVGGSAVLVAEGSIRAPAA